MRTLMLALFALTAFGQEETVMVTCRAKPGAEANLQRVLADHWTTIRDLKLVTAAPHTSLRGIDPTGKTYFVEIFTWKDAKIPDHAPEVVQKLWSEMNNLGTIEIAEVTRWKN